MPTKKKSLLVSRTNPALRRIAKAVPPEDIGSARIQNILKNMQLALHSEEDGVAIAAPQIGESLQIFIVNGRTIAQMKRGYDENKEYEDLVFINPVITKLSKSTRPLEEGCLSLRYLYGKVERSDKATVRALNEKGKKVLKAATGLLAQIFQHEVDHLNGVLFTDKARDVVDLPPRHA